MALLKNFTNCFLASSKLSTRKGFPALSAKQYKLILKDIVKLTPQNPLLCSYQPFSSEQSAPDAFSKFSTGIDFDALRDARMQELKCTGKNVHMNDIVKSIIKEKCDEAFANLNAEDQRKLKIAQLEHDVLYSQGYDILSADEMTSENWLDALSLTTNQRRRYFFYLRNLSYVKKNRKSKGDKLTRQISVEENLRSPEVPRDSSFDNKIFLRLYGSSVKRWRNHVLANALQFGSPLVWDMDYCQYMSSREIKNTATQLMDSYCLNRYDRQPFHLHFANCPENNPMYRYIQMYLQNDPHFMATVTPKSYMDLFDKEDLVYLSPNAHQVMTEFDPNAVYILGAFNDKAYQQPLSYARAKELGIKCMQLPLDKYVNWKMGSKSLTLNQMMIIFQSIKNKKSWKEAFTAIPTRKIAR